MAKDLLKHNKNGQDAYLPHFQKACSDKNEGDILGRE